MFHHHHLFIYLAVNNNKNKSLRATVTISGNATVHCLCDLYYHVDIWFLKTRNVNHIDTQVITPAATFTNLFLWDAKEPTPLLEKSRGRRPRCCEATFTHHIIHIMGLVGTVSS